MTNAEIARVLAEVADVLEIRQEDSFRIRAYRNAARTVEVQTEPLERLVAEGRPLTALPGIGKQMAAHIGELIATGTLAYRDELLAEIPRSLIDLMRLPSVGPKRALRLWKELGIQTVEGLEEAARGGRIAGLSGFGAKSQQKILDGIAGARERSARLLLATAERHVEPLLAYLRAGPPPARVEPAGSYRRRCDTVGGVDLVAAGEGVMARLLAYPQVDRVLLAGETRATVVLGSGLQVDLRVVAEESWGAALVYFTGSKEHNVKLRQRALRQKLHLSEYGVYRFAQSERVAGTDEREVYAALELPWIPPELREDRGEVEAAARGALPELVVREDLRGDLHLHSTWSDGSETIESMLAACAARGYEYVAITDHSKALPMVRGLDGPRLELQWAEIAALQERHPEVRLLKGLEVDILADGALDLDDDHLARLDLVVVSIHTRFDLPRAEQTARVLRALEHPAVSIWAHPTARMINRRRPIDVDLETVLGRAAELGVAVEHNSSPNRLDLRDADLLLAKRLGCKIVVSTDAHRLSELDYMRYGVEQARRAWLTAADVLNTRPLPEALAALRHGL
ncbi:MAG TPA: DNA polymerase/3'-5' exonuclease PolX [Thermoanaerobaculia bacterium]|nr:DNA polymerase/3'-5' exonuclease PolX [Thermoanaerobaculia bacterium]